ncbi:hypothetical protein CEP54_014121 [Fusarium duplospermum]|uniref:Uncharacterized protein n=1 Tax=Fusarium duplospermum TaxID=1325734 RepID=A0A428NYD6_9HYPO|nr:hypothetical protein CEP54_014121 [Fusarium duplospermum]
MPGHSTYVEWQRQRRIRASSSVVILKPEYQYQMHCVYRSEGRYWNHCSRMFDSSVTSSRLAESQALQLHDTKP